jgi:hypothetical protein
MVRHVIVGPFRRPARQKEACPSAIHRELGLTVQLMAALPTLDEPVAAWPGSWSAGPPTPRGSHIPVRTIDAGRVPVHILRRRRAPLGVTLKRDTS